MSRISLIITWLCFLGSLTILVALSLSHYNRFNHYAAHADALEESYRFFSTLNELHYRILEAEALHNGYFLLKDSSFLATYFQRVDSLRGCLTTLLVHSARSPEQHERISRVDSLVRIHLSLLEEARTHYVINPVAFRQGIALCKQTMDRFRLTVENLKNDALQHIQLRHTSKEYYRHAMPSSFRATFAFTIVALVISFIIIIREFRRRGRYQRQLEQKIIELNQSNNELEQIAYLASHDLQEPLRKISTFSNKLEYRYAHQVDEEGKRIISKINYASERMRDLVGDLAKYTTLIKTHHKKIPINLTEVLHGLISQYATPLQQKNSKVLVADNLPVVFGYRDQIGLLFECLLDNSIKFSRSGVPLQIIVTEDPVTDEERKILHQKTAHDEFVKIAFRDNGIGFHNQFAEGMFGMFKRLHSQQSEYQGKGVGLAIVKRVMSNHNGVVLAQGKPSEGATFFLYFPTDVDVEIN